MSYGSGTYGQATYGAVVDLPAGPTSLLALPLDPSRVRLTWTINAARAVRQQIQRRTANSGWSDLVELDADATLYEDPTTDAETTYTYRLRALNPQGVSEWSNDYAATTPAGFVPEPPTPPANVVAVALSAGLIRLTWVDTSVEEQGFAIQRMIGRGEWSDLTDRVPHNAAGYTDQMVLPANSYTYRVRSYNAVGVSAWSNEANAVTPEAS